LESCHGRGSLSRNSPGKTDPKEPSALPQSAASGHAFRERWRKPWISEVLGKGSCGGKRLDGDEQGTKEQRSYMNWHEALINPEALMSLYDSIPDLDKVKLFEIRLSDRKSIFLRFDLSRFPDRSPRKWNKSFDTAQIELELLPIHNIAIKKWGSPDVASIKIELANKATYKYHVFGVGASCSFSADIDIVYFRKIDGYMKNAK